MTTPHAQIEALADLGARLVGLVDAAQRLGHASYAMTAHYGHPQDPAAEIVCAVARGDTAEGRAALDRWLSEKGFSLQPPDIPAA